MNIPQSKWARGSKLLKLAGEVVAREAQARLPGKAFEQVQKLALRVEQTRMLVETLSQMKGAAMKAGQLLGLEATDLFPPEVIEVLSRLQSEGSSLPFETIEPILKAELGDRFNELTEISNQPIASASIGQVHTAQYRGQKIALKIQFPGVALTIDSDVALLRNLVEKLFFFTGKKADLTALFEEIRHTLHQETDYLAELNFMQSYYENFKTLQGFRIPKPIPELSTAKVLVMEFLPGQQLKDWSLIAPQKDKQIVGERMMELFLHEYLRCGLVQTDPNWGNFLVGEDCELIVLDFGASKNYSSEFRHTYRQVLSHTMHRRHPELIEVSEGFGLLDKRESQDVKNLYLQMMDVVIAPFRHVGIFDFAHETYSENSKKVSLEFARALKYSPPPRELIFLHRKLAGVFQTLKRLGVKMDLQAVWTEMMK